MKMKNIASAIALLGLSCTAFAQTAAPAAAKAPEPEYTLSYNLGATTDYRYRGISQSGRKPALQGGVDLALKSGLYLGAWASTITWIKDSTANPNTTKGPLEIDLYAGYKGEIAKDFSYDVGGLQYWYPTNNLGNTTGFANPNTFELYGALTYSFFTAKYSRSLSNTFGATNSKGSDYLDLSANFDLGSGWSIVPHIGTQRIKNTSSSSSSFSYADYSLTVNKDIDGLVLSGAVIGTKQTDAITLPGSGTKDLGKAGLVLSIKKNF